VPALNARLKEAYEPAESEAAPEPVAEVPYEAPVEPTPLSLPAPAPEAPAAQEAPKVVVRASRPTLFGGAGRQTNTFGRRN